MKRKIVVSVIGAVIIILIIVRIFVGKEKPASQMSFHGSSRSGPVVVTLDSVRRGTIADIRECSGNVKAAAQYIVAAKVSGRLLSLNKRNGDRVIKDEIIGKIDDFEYRQSLNEAEAAVRVAQASVTESEAQLNQVKLDVERITTLVNKGISPSVELENAHTQLASQQARVALNMAQLSQKVSAVNLAKLKLDYTNIKVYQSGFVASRSADNGALLSVNSPLITVVSLDTVFVEIAVSERDYSAISLGQKAQIKFDALPGLSASGTIVRIAPIFQASTRTIIAEIMIPNNAYAFKPGMFARVELIAQEKRDVQLVARKSVVTVDNESFLYCIDSAQTAQKIPVIVGVRNDSLCEIVSPVLEKPFVYDGIGFVKVGSKIVVKGNEVSRSAVSGGKEDKKKEASKKGDKKGGNNE
ncbi:MAG: efflux RND transporter periplasmic adaptor subunit [Chitinivibrionales bacterium]|nr:efflux RND transporter periplasmic adaptor subunit [Chitinivibrionales bacterium]